MTLTRTLASLTLAAAGLSLGLSPAASAGTRPPVAHKAARAVLAPGAPPQNAHWLGKRCYRAGWSDAVTLSRHHAVLLCARGYQLALAKPRTAGIMCCHAG